MNCKYCLAESNYSLRMANIQVMDIGTEFDFALSSASRWYASLKLYIVAVQGQ